MLRRIKIWSVHPFPFQMPACSLLRCWSTVSAIRWMMILARILLGTDSKVIPRDLLQFLRAPFFGIFTMTPSVRSSGNFFSSQMSLRSGWSRSAASCGSALNTSAPRLSCPGDFSFSRELMAALIFSWGISVDIQVSRCLLYICFFWWWFVCSEYHFVLPCLLHLLPGLQARSWVSACLFLSLSSLFGSLPSTVDCICLSLGLKDFLLQSSSVLNGFPGILCDPVLPLPLLCSKAGFADLLVGYL